MTPKTNRTDNNNENSKTIIIKPKTNSTDNNENSMNNDT